MAAIKAEIEALENSLMKVGARESWNNGSNSVPRALQLKVEEVVENGD